MILKAAVLRTVARQQWHFGRTLSTEGLKGVVGLEVHVQISSQSKLFSHAPAVPGPANEQVALFDAAIPGTLPVLNRRCVEAAVQTALALNCEQVNKVMRFERKHYFYADMPAGYQITQQSHPVARRGALSYCVQNSPNAPVETKTCRIHQIQLEQDSGKSIHDIEFNTSLIDLNRAGVGLLEIVFEPDLSCGSDAANVVKDLVAIVKAIGVCTGRMEEGAVRVDANVSVHRPGEPLGTRTEIKNMNSIRSVRHAIDYEVQRQIRSVEEGRPIANVTMTFDTKTNTTVVLRDKEAVQDYRFFPEPNLPLVDFDQVGICVDEIRKQLPPLPSELHRKLVERYGLRYDAAVTLVREADLYNLFIDTVQLTEPKYAARVAHLLLNDVLAYLYKHSVGLLETKLTPKNLAQVVAILESRRANYQKCVEMLWLSMADGTEPQDILRKNNWFLIDDITLLSGLCDEAISLYPTECNLFRKKKRGLQKLLSHIKKATDERADMKLVKNILSEKILGSTVIQDEARIGR